MPNWCFNYLDISGGDVSALKTQLNTPFEVMHDSWNRETGQMEKKLFKYSKPVFAFWNIVKPTNLEAYYGPQPETDLSKGLSFDSDHWYDWNVRNWGTKWDVCVNEDDKYPETELTGESKDFISYRFNTAWSPPVEAIVKLSEQYPNLVFTLSFEEETGWGGEVVIVNGEPTETESYDNKCRDCEALNTLQYCDNDCGEICDSCHYLGEADLEAVAECEEHKVYLTEEYVPNYRMDQVDV
jgi:hypothetical protein